MPQHTHDYLDRMLDQALASVVCPVCKRAFDRSELKLKGMFERHGIIQASCSEQHNPTVVIFIADGKLGARKRAGEQPLSTRDVLHLHEALKTFDGNFKKLFTP